MSEPSVSRRRRRRLSRSGDFDNALRRGASAANRHMVVYAFERATAEPDPAPRLGLAVSRKVGNAVERNTIKRVLREQFAGLASTLRPGVDIVVIARPGLSEYLAERGSSAVGDRLAELAHQVASPDSDTGSERRPRLEG